MGYFGKYFCLVIFLYVLSNSSTDGVTIGRQELQKDEENWLNFLMNNLETVVNQEITSELDTKPKEMSDQTGKIRVKRQGGAGKYTEAAKMPQVKLMRLNLQMFKNFIDPSHVGGSHPFHHTVPKPVMELFVQKLLTFFFPPVGVPDKTQ